MNAMIVALILAVPLILLGFASAYQQLRGRRDLAARTHVPSDERAYLQGRYRRRLLAATIMIIAGVMIAAAYLSGMEATADALKPGLDDQGEKQPLAEQDKQFLRMYGLYWISVVLLAFALVGIAIKDAWATRRYWLRLYREMKADHNAKLRRDLAVYRQQKDDRGARRGTL